MSDIKTSISEGSRREFIKMSAAAAAVLSLTPWSLRSARAAERPGAASVPWFQRAARWGQTNIVEIDPLRYDIAWWQQHWRRTRVQGVVLNGGGIVAYYPTKVPFHRRAEFLVDRDLFGDLLAAAREEELAVFARMDSHRADETLFHAHPDWFAQDAEGKPYMSTGLYVACVNGPYYKEHIPAILREIAENYQPDGFTDNNWNGPMRDQPCFCSNCRRSFRDKTGNELPRKADWDDSVYRAWIMWNYERRLEIWEEFNAVTRGVGGPDCLWVGMMAGSQNWQARVFRDDREVFRRSEMIMLDDQRRFDNEGFQHNGEIGKRIRSVGGWDKVIPESMAMYHLTENNFRHAAKPEPEVRMWVVAGYAGGVQPWWHHVGADQQDRRMLKTAEPFMLWHEENEQYLMRRRPVANVGMVWSQRNMDFFGRDDGGPLVDEPWNGFGQALIRARIPYVPVHIDDIEREAAEMQLLILPNIGAMSDEQVAAVRSFAERGGSVVATGATSLCDQWGVMRPDLALGNLFGVSVPEGHGMRRPEARAERARGWQHSYLRLSPELRASVYGPATDALPVAGSRHEVLAGFEDTDILAFGGILENLVVDAKAVVPLTFVPVSPNTPAEGVYMREPRSDIPGLVLRDLPGGGRAAYLPADLDLRFSRDRLPDHADLLANIVKWTLRGQLPVEVEGSGLVDCHLYRQEGRLILHLVNLSHEGAWRTPLHELNPIGLLNVRVRTEGLSGRLRVRSIVSRERISSTARDGGIRFELPRIVDHEVLVIEA